MTTTPPPKPTKRRTLALTAIAVAVLLALVLLVLLGILLVRRAHKGAAEAGPKRVAVLPFQNLGAADDDYLVDGVSDAVRSKLASLPGLEVIARASSTAYKRTTATPAEIARGLAVRYLLRGTVNRQKGAGTAGRIQIAPELVQVTNPAGLSSKWKKTFEAETSDIFTVQSDIARGVARSLGVAVGSSEDKRIAAKPTQNLAAYDNFLRGEEISRKGAEDPPSLRQTLSLYDQAVALDPSFAQAWAHVSLTSCLLYGAGPPDPALGERARAAAEKAIALAPESPEGYEGLGIYEEVVAHNNKRALELFARRLQVAPPGADLLRIMARVEQSAGRWDAAAEHLIHAERLDPHLTQIHKLLGSTLIYLRRYSEARQVLDRGLALTPAELDLIEFKAMTFLGQGDLARARAVVKMAPREVNPSALVAYIANYADLVWLLDDEQRDLLRRLTPDYFGGDRAVWGLCLAESDALRGDAIGVQTHAEEARRTLEEQVRAGPEDAQRHASLGLALAYLGRKEEAVREGERAVSLQPVTKDAVEGPYNQHQLARIYILVGEPEKALDQLEQLLRVPYWLSPGWLQIDPNFDPLRTNSRFQKLVATSK